MKQQSYYRKITRFISLLIITSYVIMLLISSIAFAYIKISAYNSIKRSQLDYYNTTLNNITSNINTNINSLNNSGAIQLCKINNFLNSPQKIETRFNNIQNFLKTINNNFFSSFYLIGDLNTNYSLFYDNESHSLEYVNFYYDDFLYESSNDNFIKHYENIFKYSKSSFESIPVPEESRQSFNKFNSNLDGKYIYYTLYDSVMCVFVFKDNYFESAFYDSTITGSSLVLKNSLDEVIYSYASDTSDKKQLEKFGALQNTNLISAKKLYLNYKPHFQFYTSDIFFLVISLIGLLISAYFAAYSSKKHCDTIFKPYRILFSFFSLLYKSHNFEQFDYSKYNSKNRSGIGKIILNSVIYNVILPFVLLSTIQMLSVYWNTRTYPQKNLEISHAHQVEQLNNEIHSWIMSLNNCANSAESTSVSNLSYNITLDKNFNVIHLPFALDSTSNSLFNESLSLIKQNYSDNANSIFYINSDYFGEHAIGLPIHNKNGTYTLAIQKIPSLGSLSSEEMAEFF